MNLLTELPALLSLLTSHEGVPTVLGVLLLLAVVGVLSISSPMKGAGRADYYISLAREDYYNRAVEEPGRWQGTGADALGLSGPVERQTFHHLLNGLSPDGRQKLVQNAGHAKRQTGWDLTFSAPKSVSVLWATSPEGARQVVDEAHRTAVTKALTHLEETAGITRRGKGGAIKEKARLTFATFQHGASRAQDPQLHTHAVLINLGLRRDGTAGTLQSLDVFRAKMRAGAMYHNELAAQLRARLGLVIEPAKSGFRVAGVPEELCKVFSKRRQAIEKSLSQRGEHGAVASKEAALRTRQRKQHIPRAELFVAWQKEAAQHGWTQADTFQLLQRHEPTQQPAHAPVQAEANPRSAEHNRPLPSQPRQAQTRPEAQTAASRKIDPDTVLTGFENYPDFVGPVQPARTVERLRDKDTPQPASTTAWPALPARYARPAQWEARRARPEPSTWQPYQNDWKSPRELARARRRLIRVEWQPLFPKAPKWSPARKIKAPVLMVGRGPVPRWGRVVWTKDLTLVHLRVQRLRLFPHAPRWSRLQRVSLPWVRLFSVPRLAQERPSQPWGELLWKKDLVLGKVCVQKKQLFPRAARWTRAARLELPALRFVHRQTELPDPGLAIRLQRRPTQHRSH